MKIVKIISTWSNKSNSRRIKADGKEMSPVPKGHKRVMAIVDLGGKELVTRHIIIPA